MTSARKKAAPRPLPVVQLPGVTIAAPTCHIAHCPHPPAPGRPALLCLAHDAAAKIAPMLYDPAGIEWGACLRGCTGLCELGKSINSRSSAGFKEFVRPTTGCEHLPAHMINLARGIVRRRVIVEG